MTVNEFVKIISLLEKSASLSKEKLRTQKKYSGTQEPKIL
jgi:hypothetical protein